MKFLISIFLTITLLLNSFSNVIIYITFKINQKEIAKTLCVLREQRNNTCNGNCVLKAELKKLAEKEEKHSTLAKEKLESSYTITSTEYYFATNKLLDISKIKYYSKVEKTNKISFTIFRPPIV